jgi:hypothetical protein
LPYAIVSGSDRVDLGKIYELTAEARPLKSFAIILRNFGSIGKERKGRALRIVRERHGRGRKIRERKISKETKSGKEELTQR